MTGAPSDFPPLVLTETYPQTSDAPPHTNGYLGERRIPALAVFGVVAVAVTAVVIAFVISISGERYRGPGFTELWAIPSPSGGISIGLSSQERHSSRYVLRVALGGRVMRTQPVSLRPGETWQAVQHVPTHSQAIDVTLGKLPGAKTYRSVHISPGELGG